MNAGGVLLRGIGTAAPEHVLAQRDARQFAERIFQGAFRDLDRLLPVFENTLIEERRIACPLEWYGRAHSFPESNAMYQQVALELSERAARQALQKAGLRGADIRQVIFVSTTGLATPSLDAALIQRLGASPQTQRLPIWGLGCAGGVGGLARAAQSARTMDGPVLLVAVELCSLTFQYGDRSKSNLIAVSLFGDGAAALVLERAQQSAPGGAGVASMQFGQSFSHLFPDSEDIMGWELVDGGLKVRFSRDIPSLVRDNLPGLRDAACAQWGMQPQELKHAVVHPGGAKVLAAYQESLGWSRADLDSAYRVLAAYGNMSSASVLFVLEEFLIATPASGEAGLMVALGPGFSAELLSFVW